VAKPEDGRSRGHGSSRHRRHHHHIDGIKAKLKLSRRQKKSTTSLSYQRHKCQIEIIAKAKKVYNVIVISTA
jgi:hypothetical protein